MSEDLASLYDGAYLKHHKGHFASIVRMVMSDGVITPEEHAFLKRLADKLGVEDSDFGNILKNYHEYPFETPITYLRRLESLYDLARAVFADDKLGVNQPDLLRRIAIGLGFTVANTPYIVDKALKLVAAGVGLESFLDEMNHMNR